MNTLSRAITARFFPNPDSYNAFRKYWRGLMNSERKHSLSASHHLLYLALTGKDWRRAFTPPTNRRKLENGAFPSWRMFRALDTLQLKFREEELLAPFEGLITPQMLDDLRGLLPTPSAYKYRPSDFAPGLFPFEAYTGTAIVRFDKEQTHE